jgi:Ca2+/Na+ antiporter
MQPCASGLLMAALTLALILVDFYNLNIGYAVQHALLGGIITILFFVMCNYGLEMINWVVILVIPVYVLFMFMITPRESQVSEEDEECNECHTPKKTCGCSEKPKQESSISCPARPLRIGTKCGISRAT